MKRSITHRSIIGLAVCATVGLSSCDKFLDAPTPPQLVTDNGIFASDSLTAAVVNTTLSVMSSADLFDGGQGMSIDFGLYADDLMPALDTLSLYPQYNCNISPNDSYVTAYWDDLYRQVYSVNTVIAGAGASTTLIHRSQWLGEAYFLRALQYFYLTNIFGDVPLALSTDYSVNNRLSRSPQQQVYQQIVSDLGMAANLLSDTYHDGQGNPTSDHGRPNRSAAETLLARTYLYEAGWPDAEAAAATVIDDPQYSLGDPAKTFLANSAESIWQLAPPSNRGVDDFLYLLSNTPTILPPGARLSDYLPYRMTSSLVNAFEPGDARENWGIMITSTTPTDTFYLGAKYITYAPGVQYIMMCRLAEAYLIRSEARAHEGNITGALTDLNTIRQRAKLPPLNLTDASALLTAIAQENRIEFFAEEAHRFFDLRRTGMLDAVETAAQPQKNSSWQTYKQFWPIPPMDILDNPNLTQTPGY